MPHHGRGHIEYLVAGAGSADTPFGFLIINEKVDHPTVQLFPHFAPYHQAHNRSQIPPVRAVYRTAPYPLREGRALAVNPFFQLILPARLTRSYPGHRSNRSSARRHRWWGLFPSHPPTVEHVRGDNGVVVQQHNVICTMFERILDANIISTCKAQVSSILDQGNAGKSGIARLQLSRIVEPLSTTIGSRLE